MDIIRLLELSGIPYIGVLALIGFCVVYIYKTSTAGPSERLLFQAKDRLVFNVLLIISFYLNFCFLLLLYITAIWFVFKPLYEYLSSANNFMNIICSIVFVIQSIIAVLLNARRDMKLVENIKKISKSNILYIMIFFDTLLVSLYIISTQSILLKASAQDEFVVIIFSVLMNSLIFAPFTRYIIRSIADPEMILHYVTIPTGEDNLRDRWYIIKAVGENILLGDSHIEEKCTKIKFIKKEALTENVIYTEMYNIDNNKTSPKTAETTAFHQ